jgi:hypothetical protein
MDTKFLAPVCLFVYNRFALTEQTVASLQKNFLAEESDLFIFSDGAKNENTAKKVAQVRTYIKTITGFKSVTIFESENNKGLANSIISGVTAIIERYGKVIVVEDDLVFSANFLDFMNEGLSLYKQEQKIFSICGYSNQVKLPLNYSYDAYFCTRSSSWGWATWNDRWKTVDWDLTDWDKYIKMKTSFNKWGGSDCFQMLYAVKKSTINSWAIRFCFSQFLQNKLSLFPVISKVQNDGFNGTGTNCKQWSRFKCNFDISNKKTFKFMEKIELNKKIFNSAMSYHTLLKRMWSRIMYLWYSY